jgi:hypothetical protein
VAKTEKSGRSVCEVWWLSLEGVVAHKIHIVQYEWRLCEEDVVLYKRAVVTWCCCAEAWGLDPSPLPLAHCLFFSNLPPAVVSGFQLVAASQKETTRRYFPRKRNKNVSRSDTKPYRKISIVFFYQTLFRDCRKKARCGLLTVE